MTKLPFSALRCPIDGDALTRDKQVWRCAQGHCFDIAREGYVHLLPVQNKRSKDPGDSKAMVVARRRFLEAGYYREIAAAVCGAVGNYFPSQERIQCLDAGCGEGYYLRQLLAEGATANTFTTVGLDISKWAVQAAAKRDHQVTWVVGSNANLPIMSGSLDCVLCLFGFPVYAEFARVLKPGGLLLQVDTGASHLRELREIIYPSLKPPRDDKDAMPQSFTRVAADSLQTTIDLGTQEAIADLLAMTPHLYRASQEGRNSALALEHLALSVDVTIRSYCRNVE